MPADLVELVKFLVPYALPVLSAWGAVYLKARDDRGKADADRTHQLQMTEAAAKESRAAARYSERRDAYMALVDRVTELRDRALHSELVEGRPAPADYLDGLDMYEPLNPVRQALNKVLFLGSQGTRAAASNLHDAIEDYAWDWEDYKRLDQALIDFRAAARSDLGIDEDAPEVPGDKPASPRPINR